MTLEDQRQRLFQCPDCGHQCSVDAKQCPGCGKPLTPQSEQRRLLDDAILGHVLNQSSLKVGMCLTLLGLIKVVEGVKNVRSIADELLAVNAVGFLLSGMISYFALKEGRAPHKNKKARVGDFIFSASLCMLALICGVVLIELT